MLFRLGRPLSPLYETLMRVRARAYERGILDVLQLPCPVISVGNLSLGGSGKTPHVVAVGRWLRGRGIRPAVVSRGYGGRRARGGPRVVSDGDFLHATAAEAGDEPVLIAESLPGVPVVVHPDRYAAGRTAVARFHPDLVLLDDGFQHQRLGRDVDLVLLPAAAPFGTGRVFPGGDLREPPDALRRASAVLLTGAEWLTDAECERSRRQVQAVAPGCPVFLSAVRPTGLSDLAGNPLPMEYLEGTPVAAFCAVGRPEGFWDLLRDIGADLRRQAAFRDHHAYRERDLEGLEAAARGAGAKALVTTAKDAVKVRDLAGVRSKDRLPVWVLEVEVRPEEGFWHYLIGRLGPLLSRSIPA
nr:tetraacyldisaccharide 4'-kinase [Dissulfurirhabdus thermomarina]